MTAEDIQDRAREVSALMAARLGLRGPDLARQVGRAGRLMPRAIRREARYLAQAAALAQNPKLLRMLDPAKVSRAHALVTDFLRAQDPGQRRWTALIGMAGVIGFNLLVVAGLVLVWLAWRGPA
jgi:hypothetical protein